MGADRQGRRASLGRRPVEPVSPEQPVGAPLPDWQQCPRPPRTTLVGRWCTVEPLSAERHAAPLFAAFGARRLWTYLPYGPFETVAAYGKFLTQFASGEDPLFHAILVDGRPLGVASFVRIEPAVGVLEVGHICLSEGLQRTPAATEAMFLMMRRAFDELGYRRYEWKCDALNAPSRAAALRLGFRFEGVFRQATVYKARNRDTAWFSIVDGEWPARRAALERWLAPENFDAGGMQRGALSRDA